MGPNPMGYVSNLKIARWKTKLNFNSHRSRKMTEKSIAKEMTMGEDGRRGN